MNFDNMGSHFREGRLLPRSWEGKLKLCKSAQLFDPLAQTSTKVVFLSLHYPLSPREALGNALVLYGLADFPAVFSHISHWYLSWNTTDKSKSKEPAE